MEYLLSMNWSVMDLLEDLEDEHNDELARRVREAREAYVRGEGRSLEQFIAELEWAGDGNAI